MALIDCNECKAKVSEIAEACPKCGSPVISDVKQAAQASASSNLFSSILFFGGLLWLVYTGYFNGSEAVKEQFDTFKWVIGAGALLYVAGEIDRNIKIRKLGKRHNKDI